MKIVARGTLNRGEVGSNRAVGTFPKLLGLKDGRVLATFRLDPNVHVHACGVSVAIDSRNRVLHQKAGDPSLTHQLSLLLQGDCRVAIVVKNS